jgi:protein tyrosine/serine phosphatase
VSLVFLRNFWVEQKLLLICVVIFVYCPRAGLFTLVKRPHTNPTNVIHISGIRKLFDNFHTVERGKLYRCSQISPKKLSKYIAKHGIKTLVNLRGPNHDKKWWRAERDLTQKLGVRFYNIPMFAQTMTSRKNLIKLLNVYKLAPRPILIHCQSGSDRTGEAAALWVLEEQKKGQKIALKQLSIRYGHLRFYRPAKTQLIKLWHGKDWLMNHYQTV